jgi:hypothetical protein
MSGFEVEAAILRDDDVAPFHTIRERVYENGVRVTAEWAPGRSRVALQVHGAIDRRNAPAYVELFFHDAFLILNLSCAGAFAGRIAFRSAELRVRDLTFSPRLFLAGRDPKCLPIEQVVSWYDALGIGTRQIAPNGTAVALFQLLHLSRDVENEEESILRLATAAERIIGRPDSLRRLFELRETIAHGRMPVLHPLHDDALDPRVEDTTREWIEVADAAASAIIVALREQILRANRLP